MLVILVLVAAAGLLLAVTTVEWMILLLCCGGSLALELVNSAIEKVIDLTTQQLHPLAKMAKDMAAGAVLIWTAFCAVAGIIIFLPKLAALFA